MKNLIVFIVVCLLAAFAAFVGVIVEGKVTYARQKVALQAHYENRIQELTESNKHFVVGYFKDGSIGSIFELRDPNEVVAICPECGISLPDNCTHICGLTFIEGTAEDAIDIGDANGITIIPLPMLNNGESFVWDANNKTFVIDPNSEIKW